MKKVFTLIVSFLLLISTAAWAEEDSYGTDTERERIEVRSEYKLTYECECLPQVDDGEPGLIVKVEVGDEWTYFTIQSETMTMEELFKLDWTEKAECSWDAALSLDAGAKLGFQVEVDVGKIGEMAEAAAAEVPGADLDKDGKIDLDDAKDAAETAVADGADPTVNKMEFQRPTRLSDEDERYEVR
jgi:hypothetical protein